MKEYPIEMGVLNGNIILGQVDNESGQEQTITISPTQVEHLVSALRIAVETLQKSEDDLKR